MRVLNLYAGVGGNRKLWTDFEVTAVENIPEIAQVYQDLYPDDFVIVTDAHEYLRKHFMGFDFIWASPPCPTHSRMSKATRHPERRFPDMKLYEEILFLQHFFKGNWVVENVVPYYEPLIRPTKQIGRHLFWANFEIHAEDVERPSNFIKMSNLEGKQALMDWLGVHYEKNIYYGDNHCPAQILRNCVHPDIGLQVFNSAFSRQEIGLENLPLFSKETVI